MKNLLVLGLVAVATAIVPAQAGTYTLGPAATVGLGDSFDMTLTLADPFAGHPGDAITSFGFNVGILDPSVVSYTGFTAGSLFFDATFGPIPTVLVFANDPGGLSTLTPGYSDPFIIGVLHFSALQYGTTGISVFTDAANDPNQGLYYASSATAEDFSASSDATVAPEPGTLAISALGVCALALASRRRRAA
ncbi:MAG: PEP-CTERM sorting domain-containing protein [Candidatus Solibacter sp.]